MRVAFVPHLFGEGWLGGINYFRNLFTALGTLERPRLEPLLLVRAGEREAAQALRGHVGTRNLPAALDRQSGLAGRAVARVAPLSWALWRGFLHARGVGLISHSPPLLPRALLPSLGFIYDLQHRELPELFSAEDRRHRDHAFFELCRTCTAVVVSSEHARSGLEAFLPQYAHKVRVLRFVANAAVSAPTPPEVLKEKYGLPDAFVYLPNQFWKHKNHVTVLQALALLKGRRKDVAVVASGATTDYRHAEHFAALTDMIRQLGLEHGFRMLGVVPYEDLLGLMRACVAVLNPSLFEGWSTTVEEAKSLGKRLLLSDIPVHVEQRPERALYFEALSAEQLADRLSIAFAEHSPEAERRCMERAAAQLPERLRAFGRAYEDVALETMGRG